VKEVSARLLVLCDDLARAGGAAAHGLFRELDLPGAPRSIDPASRVDFSVYLTVLDRLRDHLGGLTPLEDAFARASDAAGSFVPEWAALGAGFTTPLALARFFNTVLLPAHVTCVHPVLRETVGEAGAYEVSYLLADGYAGTPALAHATVGLLRGQPRYLGLAEASVAHHGSARALHCFVNLPDDRRGHDPPASLADARPRIEALLDALVSDGAAYRRDTARLTLAVERLGQTSASPSTRGQFAEAVVELVREVFAYDRCVLWEQRDDARARLAVSPRLGAGGAPRSSAVPRLELPLLLAGELLGILDVDARDGRETLEALLPLIALGLHERPPLEPPPPSSRVRLRAGWKLTPRQIQVVELVAAGCSNAEIAGRLGCAVGTVEDRLTVIYAKVGVEGRLGLAVKVLESE
jgi:DNA-binding CsgD family transcriptional regulator